MALKKGRFHDLEITISYISKHTTPMVGSS